MRTVATITNLAYGYAGWALLPVNLPVAAGCFILMIGSTIHHHHLKRWSLKYDYIAMYIVLLALIGQYFHLPSLYAILGSITVATILYNFLQSSRIVIGIGIATILVLSHLSAGFEAFEVMFVMAVAFMFNYSGDSVHKDHHDIIHGIGWHIPSAYAIYLTSNLL